MDLEVTINDFVRYRRLKQEHARLTRQIAKLEETNGREVTDKATGSLPYFPYTERHIPIVGLLHNTSRINAKKDQLADMEAEMLELIKRFKEFLPTVEDSEIRETLELYYIDGLRYGEIAEHMGLEGDGSWLMQKARRYMREMMKLNVNHENRNGIV